MNNKSRMPSEKVRKIREEISKTAINSDLNYNLTNRLAAPKFSDLEKNLHSTSDYMHNSSSIDSIFFNKYKSGGFPKKNSSSDEIGYIPKNEQNKSLSETGLPNKITSKYHFFPISIPSCIDNSTISEGLSIFWSLSNEIESKANLSRKEESMQKVQLDNTKENEVYDDDEDVVILPDPKNHVEVMSSPYNLPQLNENIPKPKKSQKSLKRQESSVRLQKQNTSLFNTAFQNLSQLHQQQPIIALQSQNQLNYPNYNIVQNQSQPNLLLLQHQLNTTQQPNAPDIQLQNASIQSPSQLQQILPYSSSLSNPNLTLQTPPNQVSMQNLQIQSNNQHQIYQQQQIFQQNSQQEPLQNLLIQQQNSQQNFLYHQQQQQINSQPIAQQNLINLQQNQQNPQPNSQQNLFYHQQNLIYQQQLQQPQQKKQKRQKHQKNNQNLQSEDPSIFYQQNLQQGIQQTQIYQQQQQILKQQKQSRPKRQKNSQLENTNSIFQQSQIQSNLQSESTSNMIYQQQQNLSSSSQINTNIPYQYQHQAINYQEPPQILQNMPQQNQIYQQKQQQNTKRKPNLQTDTQQAPIIQNQKQQQISQNQQSFILKSQNNQPNTNSISITPQRPPIKLNEKQLGCVIEIKKTKTRLPTPPKIETVDLKTSIELARNEIMKKGTPPIPTSGVYERPQKAKRHVRRRKQVDFFPEFGNEPSSPNNIQNSNESLIPTIPIFLIQSKATKK